MKRRVSIVVLTIVISLFGQQQLWGAEGVIRLGFNLPLTGMFELVGSHSKNAAELIQKDINQAGGIDVGGKKFKIDFLYGDNKSNPSVASALAVSQVSTDKVLGVIGPLSSRQAIPVGQMSNAFSTPMISPWSTSPVTTKDKPYVFRSCFVFTVQGPVITKFVASEFNATKAAVLYDIVSAYPRGMANSFKEAFEAENGVGSVVAFEEFRTGDEDFSVQLERIRSAGAEFIFSPQHYNEVPLIVKQMKNLDLAIPLVGSNSWAGGDLIGNCGTDCNGLFFTGNYAPGNAQGINKEFVEKYKDEYGENPDEPAALTWDAVRVMIRAIKDTGGLTGNLLKDRSMVRDAIVKIQDFDGASGMMSFNESGNPSKCAVVVRIDDDGVLTFHDSVCP